MARSHDKTIRRDYGPGPFMPLPRCPSCRSVAAEHRWHDGAAFEQRHYSPRPDAPLKTGAWIECCHTFHGIARMVGPVRRPPS